jgi:hypothetical protein
MGAVANDTFYFQTTGMIVFVRKVGLAEAACKMQPRGLAGAAARPGLAEASSEKPGCSRVPSPIFPKVSVK